MKVLFILLIVSQFLVMGCKQDVGFNSVESIERPLGPIVPPETFEAQGPIVKILKAPHDQMIGESNEVVFEVLKGDAEIEEVTCSINSISLPCDWLTGVMKIVGMPIGEHFFQVIATDAEGLKGQAGEIWKVYDRFKRYKDLLSVDDKKYQSDILFVIDNSTSMTAEQKKISQRFDKFINQLQGLNWHIGITTTDAGRNSPWGDGKLDRFGNGDYFLTPQLGVKTAQKLFAKKVRRDERGSNTEMGILTTYRAIERSLKPKSKEDRELSKFFRPEAALSVVLVSDEDEAGSSNKSKGDHLLKFIDDQWGKDKIFQFNSIITHTKKCLKGDGVSYGTAYERLSKKTNGVVGDICANNYSKLLKNIGKGVSNLHKVYSLKCKPQDIDKDGKVDLTITPKNAQSLPGYIIDKHRVEFDEALNPGDYEFHYFCLD